MKAGLAGIDPSLVWRGRQADHDLPVIATGHTALDTRLPGGGWPIGSLTELLAERQGLGELSLLLPALSSITRRNGWLILIDPPWTPYPPAMTGHGVNLEQLLVVRTANAKESLWACEQALSGIRGGAVLTWLQDHRQEAGFAHLRRLQLAARNGRKAAFVFRGARDIGRSSPANLRLHLAADDKALHLTLLKCRGSQPGETIRLARQHTFSTVVENNTRDESHSTIHPRTYPLTGKVSNSGKHH